MRETKGTGKRNFSGMKIQRVVISGGGTGGHIFPAVAIADEIKRRNPGVDILFVGAIGKMEMDKVPAAGYKIVGLPIAGFQRKLTLSNLFLPFKILNSLRQARKILRSFQPQVVVGVGGYASGPTLQMASQLGIPALVQEQNSFPGKTNKLLAKKVQKICTAYSGLERFFPSEKIVLTGNPVRSEVTQIAGKREDAIAFYGLDPSKKTVLLIGGSLGARTLNEAIMAHYESIAAGNVQYLWQCGKLYFDSLTERIHVVSPNLVRLQFIERMDLAYAAADIIISRAGAISISELCLVGKPTILVPSPNVAEDHQTKNAMALVQVGAAEMVKDMDANEHLLPVVDSLLKDEERCKLLSQQIIKLSKPNATKDIVDTLEQIVS